MNSLVTDLLISLAILIAIYFYVFHFSMVFMLLNVIGASMQPTFYDGNQLLAFRKFWCTKMQVGDIIVAKAPDCDKLIIKRISQIQNRNGKTFYVYLLGDNPEESHDSRDYGWLSEKNIVAKVLWKKVS